MKPVAVTLLEAGIVKTIDVSLHDGYVPSPRDPASWRWAAERAAVVSTRPRAPPRGRMAGDLLVGLYAGGVQTE